MNSKFLELLIIIFPFDYNNVRFLKYLKKKWHTCREITFSSFWNFGYVGKI